MALPILALKLRLAVDSTLMPSAGMAPLVPRITLTLPALNAGAQVVFLVSGAEKAEAVARAVHEASCSSSIVSTTIAGCCRAPNIPLISA